MTFIDNVEFDEAPQTVVGHVSVGNSFGIVTDGFDAATLLKLIAIE